MIFLELFLNLPPQVYSQEVLEFKYVPYKEQVC